ncbi:hypothetical protein [Hyalangium gracile]|uniref:hypothetical protein n=1 Tax=Hyalangium gracile TaxID=394092 RepID=UPI001CCF6DB1|nr:hypothetical protein [Hyalangium gracile]
MAEAWRALGDPVREAQALKDFLQAHPDSLLAESAGCRLKELSPPAPSLSRRANQPDFQASHPIP